MKAINTIPEKEYSICLSTAMRRMCKKLSALIDEECSKMQELDNKGEDEKALIHAFNARALQWATYAITLSPKEVKQNLHDNPELQKGGEK